MFIFQEFVDELIKLYIVGGRYQAAFNIRTVNAQKSEEGRSFFSMGN